MNMRVQGRRQFWLCGKACFILVLFWTIGIAGYFDSCSAQSFDRRGLVERMQSSKEQRDQLMVGLGYTTTQTQVVDGEEKFTLTTRTERLKKNVWRRSGKKGKDEGVHVRNEDFAFEASKLDQHEFQYDRAQYGLKDNQELRNSVKIYSTVLAQPIEAFVGAEEYQLTPLSDLPDQNNRRVEGVRFQYQMPESQVFRGELHWLPDHYYVLTKVYAEIHSRKNTLVLDDKEITYSDSQGRVFPSRILENSRGGYWLTEITNVSLANSSDEFYKPESLGLETPERPPSNRWWLWVIGAIVALAGAIIFWRRNSSRH